MKISIIGAGNVGATTAMRLLEADIADIVLLDIAENIAKGKAEDLMDAASLIGHGRQIVGTSDYKPTENSDIVVITAGFARKPGMEQPILYWKPSIAVCGIDFYKGALFPKWNNCLLVGALKYEEVRVLRIEKDRVMHQEVILKNAGRVRDVACGPEGAIYVILNKPDLILRLTSTTN